MPTSLDQYLPFDAGAGANVTEQSWRDMMKHMAQSQSGVVRGFDNDFQVIGDSSGMVVKVNTGQCFMRGHYGRSSAQKTLSISAAHATLGRRDAVILRADFNNNRIELDVLTGTPAASPTFPNVTQSTAVWETLLAEVTVAAAVVTITAGAVTDRRVYTTAAAKFAKTGTQSIATSSFPALANYDSFPFQSGDIGLDNANGIVVLNRAGLWLLNAYVGWTANATGARAIQIRDSGSTIYSEADSIVNSAGVNTWLNTIATERFSAGQQVRLICWQSSGGALNTLSGSSFTAMWIGP